MRGRTCTGDQRCSRADCRHTGQLVFSIQPFSLFDVDWFHRSWPTAPDDRTNRTNRIIEPRSIAAVWRNYTSAGPRRPVIPGGIETAAERRRCAEAFALPARSVLLIAGSDVAVRRLRSRSGPDRHAASDWHPERHRALASKLLAGGADVDLGTVELSAQPVAHRIIARFKI